MPKQPLAELLATAQEHQEAQPQIAIETLRDIVLGDHPNDAESIKIKEQALQKLANLYAKQHDATALRTLLAELRPLFTLIPKAKTAKIVRTVVDTIAKVPNSTDIQVHHCWLSRSIGAAGCLADLFCLQLEVCKEQVQWAQSEKRTFLRQRIEIRLATLYLETKEYTSSISLIGKLLTEVTLQSLLKVV